MACWAPRPETRSALLLALGSALLMGCNAPEPPEPTGGTDVPPGPCGRGLSVVCSDYQSTNVALVGLEGEVLSSSFISSATTSAQLTAPLSGDVAVPTMATLDDELPLLDRYPASVLTWVAVADGSVRGQLDVATGFPSNPQDYVTVAEGKAYVSRYDSNASPGAEPFDAGSDLLVVDPLAPAIVDRIDLSAAMQAGEAGFQPHPNRLALVGDDLFVLLAAYNADYTDALASRVAVVDVASDAVTDVARLDGLHGCAGLATTPDGSRLAVTCSGSFGGSSTPTTSDSGVVLLAIEPGQSPPLREIGRWLAADVGGQPLGFGVDFAASDRLLLVTMGQFGVSGDPDVPDTLLELDASTGEHRVLLTSESLPFVLGEVRCTLPCAHCFAANAEASVLHRLTAGDDGWLTVDRDIVVDTAIGLPPRGVGRF